MSKPSRKFGLDKWLSIVTVATSIIALIFSWQANRFASKQATAQMVVLDTVWYGGAYRSTEDGEQATCKQLIRLTNLGGVSTAITSYKVKILYAQSQVEFENSFSRIIKIDKLTPQIGNFEIYLLLDTAHVDIPELFDNSIVLELPRQVESYSTFDIQTAVKFSYDLALILESPTFGEPNSTYFDPTKLNGYIPMMVSYSFKTSAGQTITTPAVACWYIKNR